MSGMKYMGVDIGGTKIAYGLFDADGVMLDRFQRPTPLTLFPDEFTRLLSGDITDMLGKNSLPLSDLAGVGLGFPSYVDYENGIIVHTVTMPNLGRYPAREMLHRALPGVSFFVDNDTNAAVLAEHLFGAGRGRRHLAYVALGSGVGSGFILNGAIFRGEYGGAGESGHILARTDEEGVLCGCGHRGCIMSLCSGSLIAEHAKNRLRRGEKSLIPEIAGGVENVTAVHIGEAFSRGDELAESLIDQIAEYAGLYVYDLFLTLNIACYVFGGGLVNLGRPLMKRIRASFDRLNVNYRDQKVDLLTAELGSDVGVVGAMCLARNGVAERAKSAANR